MGLRCSLLGHDFGEPEVEREREERGSEVVLTVREIAVCSRCSKTNVVTENKEVTTLHDGDGPGDEVDELDGGESEIESVDADDPGLDADATSVDIDEQATEEDEEDDAVIVDDEDADDDRAHGEWPAAREPEDDEGDEGDDAPMEWPTVDDEDEGFDAKPSAGGDAAVEFGGGLAPERATVGDEEGLEYVESAEPEPRGSGSDSGPADEPSDEGFVRAGAAPSPADPATADVDAEVVCPQCGFVDDVVGSSMRAGDVCPDCRKGYLADQDR